MKSVEHPLVPIHAGPPTEEDLGFNLGASSADTGVLGLPLKLGQLTFVWLLWSAVMAAAALYYVFAGSDAFRLLAWTAAGAAVVLLAGASVLHYRRVEAAHLSLRWVSILCLGAFCVPLVQFLFAMILGQDTTPTVLIMLLVVGYSVAAPSVESLLTFLTISLSAWAACVIRFPEGTWQNHVVPWFGTAGLAMLIQQRARERVAALLPRFVARKPSSAVIDVDLEQQLRTAVAARETAEARCRHLEDQLNARPSADTRWEEDLFFLQESARELAQDVTLNDVGAAWLDCLGRRLGAKQTSLWLAQVDVSFKLVMGLSEAKQSDLDALLARTVQSGQLLQTGDAWSLPVDLGLNGRGVLLLEGIPHVGSASATKLLHTCGAALNLFLRWQLSDAENESLTDRLHQEQEALARLRQEGHTQDQTSRSLAEHLKQQLDAAERELDSLRQTRRTGNDDLAHWKAEAERWRRLVEAAQTEHDTLTQLLSETEGQLKRAKSEGNAQLQQRLRQLEQDFESASAGWQQAEEQVREAEAAKQRAETECRDAVEEWQHETQAVSRLTLALRTVGDAVAVFDAAGQVLVENDAAQTVRGPLRNRPGEHPLWKAVTPESLAAARRDGEWQGEVYVDGASPSGTYRLTVRAAGKGDADGYAITAHAAQDETEKQRQTEELEAGRLEAVRSGARFYAGLVRTLRPPVSSLIEHAESLLENTDPESRRTDLVGLLHHARHVRGFCTQAFDYAELEAGTATVVRAKHSPWQLLHQVVRQLRPVAEEKGLALTLRPRGPLPASITTDGDRLHAMLHQLIGVGLATSHTDEFVVDVGMEASTPTSTRTPNLEIGVEAAKLKGADLETVFTPFATTDGINLASLRRRAQALGGDLRAERGRDGGRLVLSLPVTPVEYASLSPAKQLALEDDPGSSRAATPLRGRVLLVTERHEIRRVVTFHLERFGLTTDTAADGAYALQRLQEERFQAILWDGQLEETPAPEAAKRLRSAGYGEPILLLTDANAAQDREAFFQAGGTNSLSIPIDPTAWRQLLTGCVHGVEDLLEDAEPPLRSECHADAGFVPLVHTFADSLRSRHAEMAAALQVADLAALARLAHALADNALVYGYPPLADAARQLEDSLLRGNDSHHLRSLLSALGTTVSRIERGLRAPTSTGTLTLPEPLQLAA